MENQEKLFTQEEVNEIIKKRLERTKNQTNSEDLEQIKKDYDQKINNLTSENLKLKNSALKQNIAYEYNIPRDMASRLKGETEEEIRKDADLLASYISTSTNVAPLADPSINLLGNSSKLTVSKHTPKKRWGS